MAKLKSGGKAKVPGLKMSNTPEQQAGFEKFVHEEFDDLAVQLSEAYDFPEMERANLVFVSGVSTPTSKLSKDIVPFYVRQFDSRKLGFEFDEKRHAKFKVAFLDMYGEAEVENPRLNRLATIFYLGCGMVRPIAEYEFFMKHAPLKPQHARAVRNVYDSRKDLQVMFEDLFGIDASGPMHAELVNEIPDEEILPINTTRIALSFLYGGLRDDATKVALGDILQSSQRILYDAVVSSREHYHKIATAGHMDDANQKGDWLLLNTIPSWLIAFATPIKPESYGHLSEKFWQDRFSVRGSMDMKYILDADIEPVADEVRHDMDEDPFLEAKAASFLEDKDKPQHLG